MELGKIAVEAALKAISYTQLDVRKSYKLRRKLDRVGQLSILKPLYKAMDIEVKCAERSVPVRIFSPGPMEDANDVIIFFHGGGWVTGDIDTYNRVCAVTARYTSCKVASVDYRLAPEHRFPCGPEDCYEAAHYLFLNSYDLFGVGQDHITLMGDSAGANLAAVVSLMARDKGGFSPKQQILLYPATYNDHTEKSPYASVRENGKDFVLTSANVVEYMELYIRTSEDLQSPYFAPLLAESFLNQPRTLIVSAEFDPLRDEGEDYGEKLKKAGNSVSVFRMMGALHGFISLPAGMPQVKRSYEIINAFLRGEEQITNEVIKSEIEEKHTMEPAG